MSQPSSPLQPSPASDGAQAGSREGATVIFLATISRVRDVPPNANLSPEGWERHPLQARSKANGSPASQPGCGPECAVSQEGGQLLGPGEQLVPKTHACLPALLSSTCGPEHTACPCSPHFSCLCWPATACFPRPLLKCLRKNPRGGVASAFWRALHRDQARPRSKSEAAGSSAPKRRGWVLGSSPLPSCKGP